MRIALGIVSLASQGGLQRDCLALAEALQARGHDVELFAARCGERDRLSRRVHVLPTRSLSNHGTDLAFAQAFQSAVQSRFEVVVGFNKMPGLDVYYCADPSIAAKPTPAWKCLLPRYRARRALERSCFDPLSTTSVLLLSHDALATYRRAWQTPGHRLFLLPPRIGRDRARPAANRPTLRRNGRLALGYDDRDIVWLWVATQPVTKGLDRVLDALSHQPHARLLVVGLPPDEAKARPYHRLAERLNVASRLQWLGNRDDIPELMALSDILVHPARLDVTGQVILEAVANGLPVVASAICGFAHHIEAAGAGVVIGEPFHDRAFGNALSLAADPVMRETWSAAALAYSRHHDFARGLDAAAEVIERISLAKHHRS